MSLGARRVATGGPGARWRERDEVPVAWPAQRTLGGTDRGRLGPPSVHALGPFEASVGALPPRSADFGRDGSSEALLVAAIQGTPPLEAASSIACMEVKVKTIGIDWGHREHYVALLEGDGSWSWCERLVAHDVSALLAKLEHFGGAAAVRIAIEAGAPLLPQTLRSRGYQVEEVAPDRADKMRALHFPGGAKDDARDAKTLALMAHHRALGLRGRHVPGPRPAELQQLTRIRSRLVESRTSAVQQLVDLVRRAHPGLAALDLDYTCAYALSLVRAYPDPLRARRAQWSRIARLLQRVRKLDAETVRRSLAEHGFEIPEHIAAACALEAPILAEQITLLSAQIRRAEKAIAQAYRAHPDARILLSIGGCGAQLAPRISARIDSGFVRLFSSTQTQILAGTAPCTVVSGKRTGGHVKRRTARDRDLHQALVQLARCSLAKNEWARRFVLHHTGGQLRNRKRMNKALRALANKWVRIIHTLLLHDELYEEQRHAADLRKHGVSWAPPPTAAA